MSEYHNKRGTATNRGHASPDTGDAVARLHLNKEADDAHHALDSMYSESVVGEEYMAAYELVSNFIKRCDAIFTHPVTPEGGESHHIADLGKMMGDETTSHTPPQPDLSASGGAQGLEWGEWKPGFIGGTYSLPLLYNGETIAKIWSPPSDGYAYGGYRYQFHDGVKCDFPTEGEAKDALMSAAKSWLSPLSPASDTVAVSREDDGWQPIETAPRDGSRYLLYVPREPTPDNSTTFDVYEGCFVGGYDSGDVWYSKGKDIYYPSHWMPLPAPPINTGGSDND